MHVLLQYSEISHYFHIQHKTANIKFFGEVLQKTLKVWVERDYFEALHIQMHVHISNLNTAVDSSLQPAAMIYFYKHFRPYTTTLVNYFH